MAYLKSSSEDGKLGCTFCQLFHAIPRGEKLHLLPSPQIRGAHLGNLSHFTFFLSHDNDNLFFPRFPSAGVLAKNRERMEKYLDARTWAASLRWEACACAFSWYHSFIGCGLGLGRVTERQRREEAHRWWRQATPI